MASRKIRRRFNEAIERSPTAPRYPLAPRYPYFPASLIVLISVQYGTIIHWGG